MPSHRLDAEIDRLYELPLAEFTSARNALAKTAGPDAAEVRQLAKPPVAAWAVNQVYWKQREVYDALIEASTELRKIHKSILAGRRADLREASKAHDEAMDAALKAALSILQESGHPATDSTRQAVVTTLRALPSGVPPGRLSETLQPGGFEMLQGLSIGGSAPAPRAPVSFRPKAEPARTEGPKTTDRQKSGDRSKVENAAAARAEAAKIEAARVEAAKALREAEQAARREEFEVVRTARDEEKATKQAARAREALQAAREALSAAEDAAEAAAQQKAAAARRAKEADRALEAARRHHDSFRKR